MPQSPNPYLHPSHQHPSSQQAPTHHAPIHKCIASAPPPSTPQPAPLQPTPTSAMQSRNSRFPPGLAILTALPSTLLERILSHPTLRATDLTSLLQAATATPLHPLLESSVQTAAACQLTSHPIGRLAAQSRRPTESPLSLLHFLHRLDGAVAHATAIYSCGRNDAGQGARTSVADTNVLLPTHRVPAAAPHVAATPPPVILVAAGASHSACLTAHGALHLTGANRRGQLGLGDHSPRAAWTPVDDLSATRVAQVACGAFHTAVLTADGRCLTTGANDNGQLALGDTKSRNCFEPVPSFEPCFAPVRQIAAGNHHTVVLTERGHVFAAGCNKNGQLGARRSEASCANFQRVGCFDRRVLRVACGADTTMLLTTDNMILVTGKRLCALSVIGGLGMSNVTHLSVGERFAIARTDEDDVAVSAHRKRFYVTDEVVHVSALCVSAGLSHYAIVTRDGRALAAGANAFGQVAAGEMGLTIEGGHNARVIRPHRIALSPVNVPPGFRVLQVAAGAFHTLYLLAAEASKDR